MTTKEDILNYVPFQILQKNLGQIQYLTVDVKTVNNTELNNRAVFPQILKATVECKLTEEEMVKEVDSLLTSFNLYQDDSTVDKLIIEDEVAFNIQSNSKRGVGNTRYKNSLYYKGDKLSDAPVIVAECEGQYAVFKHPNFNTYGFVIEKDVSINKHMITQLQHSHRFRLTIQDYTKISQYILECNFDYVNKLINLDIRQPVDDTDLIHLAIFHLSSCKVDIVYSQFDSDGTILSSIQFTCAKLINHSYKLSYCNQEPTVHRLVFNFNNMVDFK